MEIGDGFTWSSAINDIELSYLGEQLTHVRKLEDGTVKIGNKSGVANTQEDQYTNDEIVVAGYYTIQTRYYETAGIVKVELKVIDEDNTVIHTSIPVVLKNTGDGLSDITTTEAGGNRYGWFTYVNMGVDGLKVAEVSLERE